MERDEFCLDALRIKTVTLNQGACEEVEGPYKGKETEFLFVAYNDLP